MGRAVGSCVDVDAALAVDRRIWGALGFGGGMGALLLSRSAILECTDEATLERGRVSFESGRMPCARRVLTAVLVRKTAESVERGTERTDAAEDFTSPFLVVARLR